ncbi:MAG: sulfotransferase domain-containing protein [Flavimaricola sp.]|nr:sulfotransferase domain-containing protein [Flavimaricola sp.]
MKLPDFLVLGAQKAGSTWIYDCLRDHPQVFMPAAVELLYFNKPNFADPVERAAYEAHFADADKFERVGEKTPGYFWSTDRSRSVTQPPSGHNVDIPGAVRQVLGDQVDFIISLRHPVWRAISAFGHHAKRGRIDPKLSLRDTADRFGVLDIGFYGAHLSTWFNSYPREQFEVLIFEDDIAKRPEEGFRKVCNFLKIDEGYKPPALLKVSNAGGMREFNSEGIEVFGHPLPIDASDIHFLLEAYADDIAATKKLLGVDLKSWDEETDRLRSWCIKKLGKGGFARATGTHNSFGSVGPGLSTEDGMGGTTKSKPMTLREKNQSFGLDAAMRVADALDIRFVFEPPARLSQLEMRGGSSLGAFSYAVSGYAYGTHIGRYCSIARDVNIGQFNHTMDWLSTSPFQFQQGFCFNVGPDFPDKAVYEATKPDPDLSAKARRDLTKVTYVGNDVWIGHGAIITAGVKVGDGAVVGANAVVTKDVEPYAIVAGVPAKLIRYRFNESLRNRMLEVKWWQYASWQLIGVPFSNPEAALTEIERRVAREGMKPYVPVKVVQTAEGPALSTEV